MRERSTFGVLLRRRQFARLTIGSSVSAFGDAISPIMLAFCVLEASESVVYLGLVVSARAAAHVACLVFAGVLADRFSRVRLMTYSCLASVVSQLLLGAAAFFVPTVGPWLIIAAVLNGVTTAFYAPATMGHLPDTVDDVDLVPANAVYRVLSNGAGILGTLFASVLVVFADPALGLLVDAITFLVAAFLFASLRKLPVDRRTVAEGSLLSNLTEGWSIFWGNLWIKATVGAWAVLNFAFAAAYFVLGPALATAGLGKSAWALVAGGQAGGFLLGGVASLRMPRRHVLVYGLLCALPFAGFLFALGTDTPVAVLVMLSVIGGFGLELFNVSWQVTLQSNVPRRFLSRINSYDQLGSFASIPLGTLLAGPIAAGLGVSDALTVFAVVCVVTCLAVVSTRSVRAVELHRSSQAEKPVNG
jgi:MFS family permease